MGQVIAAYIALTKPRIIELLLITTVPAMFVAARGAPAFSLVAWTMLGGFLAAASANTFNCVWDADIDQQMRRTRRRPMARHQVGVVPATTFGFVLALASAIVLGIGANWLSAALALTANAFYVFVYTMWLKRRTWHNIVWGGIAGCFPPIIGWTAVTGRLSLAPFVLAGIVFVWTPPHTWALAFRYREDYENAGVPMLPVVKPAPQVSNQIVAYSLATAGVSLLLWPAAPTGWLYPIVAFVAGVVLCWEAYALRSRAHAGLTGAELAPMKLFHWTNTYLTVIFVAMAVDALIA